MTIEFLQNVSRLGSKCPAQLLIACILLVKDEIPIVLKTPPLLRKLQLIFLLLSPTEQIQLLKDLPLLSDLITSSSSPHPANYLCDHPKETPKIRCSDPKRTLSSVDILPFSSSTIWQAQQEFYKDQKLKAWSHVVPFQISTNRAVARLYADEIVKLATSLHTQRKVTLGLVEIGAGHGKLSYLLSQELCQHADTVEASVVCTDFHDAVFQGLQALPWIQSSGVQYATLSHECSSLAMDAVFDLVVLVANYALDSMPADLFGANSRGDLIEIGVNASGSSRATVARVIGDDRLPVSLREYLRLHPGHIFPVPAAALQIMTTVQRHFTRRQDGAAPVFSLLCGDSFFSVDDAQWRCPDLECLAPDALVPLELTIPFISPAKHVVALSLCREIVQLSFASVFSQAHLASRTACYPSAFSVLCLHNAFLPVPKTTRLLPFGPAELQILNDYLSDAAIIQDTPLAFLLHYQQELAHNDILMFRQLQWPIARKLSVKSAAPLHKRSKSSATTDPSEDAWISTLLTAYHGHYCSSWEELLSIRASTCQWLLCLKSSTSLQACLQLFLEVPSRPAIVSVAYKRSVMSCLSVVEAYLCACCLYHMREGQCCLAILSRMISLCEESPVLARCSIRSALAGRDVAGKARTAVAFKARRLRDEVLRKQT